MAIVSARNVPQPYSWRGKFLRYILRSRGSAISELDETGRADLALIRETRSRVPLLLTDIRALNLLACARAALRMGGGIAEAGVLAGGSARLICAIKGAAPLHLFDSFDTLKGEASEPGAVLVRDYFGRFHSKLESVQALLADFENVHFHPGWFPRSCDKVLIDDLALVHLDLDLEQSTRDALAWFWPRMRSGGIIVADDYNIAGVRRAIDDHSAAHGIGVIVLPWAQAIITKV